MHEELTPRQIVAELDKYIIGQTDAKKSVAIALRNRWRRMNAPEEMRDEIMPNNIVMIGPTGVGKTEIARRLARLAGAPFIKVEATKFTEVGYVGRDVDSIVRDLTDFAVGMIKEEQAEGVQERARQQAEERVLDVLIPPSESRKEKKAGSLLNGPGFVIRPQEEAEEPSSEEDLRERTRDRFRTMLREGKLAEREVEIDVASEGTPTLQMFGPMGLEEMGINIQEMFGNLGGGKKKKKRRMTVEEAVEALTVEEAQKLIDMDAVQKDAIERVQQAGIVFIDEIDKVAGGSRQAGGPDVSREGVQRDLLPIVEGSNVMTKYGMVKTDHILFIASGAFHVSKPSDLIPELQGRFPIRVELDNLTENDFYKILTIPQNALLKQYQALLASEGVEIEFTEDAVREVARIAAQVNEEVENIGARRLHTILTTLLEETLFEVPEQEQDDNVVVDEAYVRDRLQSVVENRDLSQYIL